MEGKPDHSRLYSRVCLRYELQFQSFPNKIQLLPLTQWTGQKSYVWAIFHAKQFLLPIFHSGSLWLIKNHMNINFFYSHLFILKFVYLRRPQNFAKSPPDFCLQYIQTKVRWRFCKVLWPSQNIWTFKYHIHKFPKTVSFWFSRLLFMSQINWMVLKILSNF